MTRDELRNSLRQPYNRENWTGLVRSVFGNHVRLESTARQIPAEDDSIKSIAQIGDVMLDDGRNLTLIEVEVDDKVNLLRNRVSLRNRVAKFIDQGERHGVLAVFSSSRPEYRFTFTAKETLFDETEGMVEKETATKRFTYVLGPGETCTTAAQRFERLSQKTDALNLDDVIDAFSVEKLNKEFFNNYKEHYTRFCDYLLSDTQRSTTYKTFGIPAISDEEEQKKQEKPVRDFVKRLLGRIVFLHFLQKKGWMGCPTGSDAWTGGEPDFLSNYFAASPDKARFHSQRLIPLFYEALNQPDRPDDLFPHTGTRIPYLNGGLFEKLPHNEQSLDFPEQLFTDLLGFFGQYNFTIDENDPDEHEVGIDPEMLGHIFENLLEDNKDKGAYYTPKPIVHYMCQQSLIYYLLTHLDDTEEARAAIEYLVRSKQIGENTPHGKFIKANAAHIEELLDKVKICDPAIGSGAFPIGLLQEIFWLKLTLDMTLNTPEQLANVKRAIIQNSIYGVDIDAGAVDIARLRFWLALVVDEDRPRPLPNLDYKIMQGDSLLESFEGIPLDNLVKTHATTGKEIAPEAQSEMDFGSGQMKLTEEEKVEEITSLMEGYFSETNPAEKQRIHKEIDQFVLTHIYHNLTLESSRIEKELGVMRRDIDRKKLQLPTWKIPKKTETTMSKLSARIKEIGQQRKSLEALEKKAERPYFLWHLFFQDVFERGGFDIVIANPPYYDIKGMQSSRVELLFKLFETCSNRINLYSIFIEHSFRKLLAPRGVLSYINPNSLLFNSSYDKLRKLIVNDLISVIKLPDNIFHNATVETILLFLNKDSNSDFSVNYLFQHDDSFNVSFDNCILSEKSHWQDDPECRFNIYLKNDTQNLLKKIDGRSDTLGSLYYTSLGITPYDKYKGHSTNQIKNRVFHSTVKVDDSYVPLIDGESINRYHIIPTPKEWLKYGPHLGAPREKRFFTSNRVIVRQIMASNTPRIRAAFTDLSLYHTQIGFSLLPKYPHSPPPTTLCSLLNSKLVEFYHQNRFIDPEKVVFQKILIANTKKLPIPPATDEQKSRLSELAEAAAEATTTGDTAALQVAEDKINQIVYQLFDLTPTEITFIEESLNP
jgi:type I restriction-modification system DNA methylase subunit